MEKADLIYRFLKAREDVNENAKLLIAGVKSGRGDLDAVMFDMEDKDFLQKILSYSELVYYLADINNNLVLIYPNEQRQRYLEIQPLVDFRDEISEFEGFSYAEALAAKDFLQASGVQYTVSINHDGQSKFSIPKCKEYIMETVIDTILSEEQTLEGRKYFESRNLHWLYAIDQAKKVIASQKPHFVGSEGGSKWIYVNKDEACIFNGNDFVHVPRDDYDFKRTVITSMLYELNGENTPIKVFSGDFAQLMFGEGVTKSVTKSEALKTLGLSSIPDMTNNTGVLAKWFDKKDKSKKETEAFYTILRMSACRSISNDDIKPYKITKKDKEFYEQLHQKNIDAFQEDKGIEER